MIKRLGLILFLITLSSCGIETYDANEAFEHWSGNSIEEEEVEIVNGQFLKSRHWTYEYAVFMELKPSNKWKEKFFEIYKAEENLLGKYDPKNNTHQTNGPNWFENPEWFKLNSEYLVYQGYGGNFYWNEKENTLLIFEIQL